MSNQRYAPGFKEKTYLLILHGILASSLNLTNPIFRQSCVS